MSDNTIPSTPSNSPGLKDDGGEPGNLLSSLDQEMAEVESLLEQVGEKLPRETEDAQLSQAVLRLRRSRLATLYDISQQLGSLHRLQDLLPRFMDLVIEMMNVERGLIMLRHQTTGQLEVVAARNMESETLSDASQLSQSIIDDVLGGGKPVLTSNAQRDPRLRNRQSVVNYGIKSILCVPIRLGQQVLGTVYVDDRRLANHFKEEDLAFLVCFANIAAISYENARLIEQARGEVLHLQREVKQKYSFDNLVGNSAVMQQAFRKMESVIQSDVNVLLEGESGTGKELVARAIHYNSNRRDKLFVPLNCGALPDTLIESELFGHRKGSFTGATMDKKGLFEMADEGTIFLDEISNTSLMFQAKLLRVLQEGELRRVGDPNQRQVDVRVIAATNKDLRKAVEEGTFREDLYYRLNVISIGLYPLRERHGDIPLLVDHFLTHFAKKSSVPRPRLSRAAMEALLDYHWPGNVRELENTIQKGMVLAMGAEIQTEHLELPRKKTLSRTDLELREARDRFEAEFIDQALTQCAGNVSRTARRLGISRPQLHRLLQKHDIQSVNYRK